MSGQRLVVGGQGPGGSDWRAAAKLLSCAALVFLLSASAGATTGERPVVVTARVEPETVGIGVPFRYVVRVEVRGEAEIVTPLLVERIGDFLIRDFGSVPQSEAPDGARVSEQWYELVGYEAGLHLVRSGVIAYREPGGGLEQIEVPETVVTIAGMIDESADPSKLAPREIAGPIGVPRRRPYLWYAAAAALLGLAVVVAMIFWRRRRRAGGEAAARPPHEVALEALTQLRRSRLLEEGRAAEFYVRLSAIVRQYVEGRYHLRAPEMTTEEFLKAAQSSRELPAEFRGRLGGFLAEADLVKFARLVPTLEQGERAFDAARDFVARTQPAVEETNAAA